MRGSLHFAWKLALSDTFFCANDLGTCSVTQPAGVGKAHKQWPSPNCAVVWGKNHVGELVPQVVVGGREMGWMEGGIRSSFA